MNVCDGLPAYDKPTDAEIERWMFFWDRHLIALTDEDEANYPRIEQPIAWKVQNVQVKRPIGVALCGGQGIGKSALFDVILRSLFGQHLVAKTAGLDLKERFRLQLLGS